MDDDPHDLQRFVAAQDGTYPSALRELRAGQKRSHWMWFVFPQLRGLGSSSTAMFYAIASLDEARAYLAHPVLGARLAEATGAVLTHQGRSLNAIFGSPDDMKFRSSMTLFATAAGGGTNDYALALQRLCGGVPDKHTLDLLGL